MVSCHVCTLPIPTDIPGGKLVIRPVRGCLLRHSTRRLCVVNCLPPPLYLRRYVARRPSFAAAASKLPPPALSLSPCSWCRVTRFLDLSVTVHGSSLLHHCSSGGSKARGGRSGGRGSTAALRSAAAAAAAAVGEKAARLLSAVSSRAA